MLRHALLPFEPLDGIATQIHRTCGTFRDELSQSYADSGCVHHSMAAESVGTNEVLELGHESEDGVVVGSALIEAAGMKRLGALVKELRAAIDLSSD